MYVYEDANVKGCKGMLLNVWKLEWWRVHGWNGWGFCCEKLKCHDLYFLHERLIYSSSARQLSHGPRTKSTNNSAVELCAKPLLTAVWAFVCWNVFIEQTTCWNFRFWIQSGKIAKRIWIHEIFPEKRFDFQFSYTHSLR